MLNFKELNCEKIEPANEKVLHITKLASLAEHYMSRIPRKSVFGVSNHVRHKPGCMAKEDGRGLEACIFEFRK